MRSPNPHPNNSETAEERKDDQHVSKDLSDSTTDRFDDYSIWLIDAKDANQFDDDYCHDNRFTNEDVVILFCLWGEVDEPSLVQDVLFFHWWDNAKYDEVNDDEGDDSEVH